eukprot:8077526-Pyramimonas_sp.AAC.1
MGSEESGVYRFRRATKIEVLAHYAGIVQKFLRVHWIWAIDIHDWAPAVNRQPSLPPGDS